MRRHCLTKRSHRQLLLVIKLFIEQVKTALLCLPELKYAILEKNDILSENYIYKDHCTIMVTEQNPVLKLVL